MNTYVLTHTKHTGLLAEFAERFEKYWGEPFFVYVSNTDIQHWSDGVLNFLRSIQDEYLILLHEDFYLTKPVDKELLKKLKEEAVKRGVSRMSLLGNHSPERTYGIDTEFYSHHADAPYVFSLEASIQKRQFLLDNLKGGCNPWDAENGRLGKAKGLVLYSKEPAIFYQDKMRQGNYETVI